MPITKLNALCVVKPQIVGGEILCLKGKYFYIDYINYASFKVASFPPKAPKSYFKSCFFR